MKTAALLIAAVVFCFALPACEATDVAEFNDRITELRDESLQWDEFIAQTREQAKALPPGPERDRLIATIVDAQAKKAKADAALGDYIAKIEQLGDDANEWDAAEAGAKTASTVLPPPAGEIAGLVSIAFAGLAEWKRRRTKRAATAVVNAIEDAKDGDGAVRFGDPATDAVLRASMGKTGQDLVRSAKSK